ncbi:MAG: hypothetical protein ABW221_03215 [Vicinamibacteria bacterium]
MIHAGIVVVGALLLAPAGAPGAAGTYAIGGPFAFQDAIAFRTADWDGPKVAVLLLEKPVDRSALARTLDVEGVLEAAKEAGSWAQLDFAEDGTWKQARHQLRHAHGSSSGTKYDGAFASTMKATIAGGRVSGRVRADFGAGDAVDLTLGLPIAAPPAATALPADGGEPGLALRACAAAYARKALSEVTRLCQPSLGDFIGSAIRQKESDPWSHSWAGECQVAAVSELKLQAGVTTGDEARLQAEGGWDEEYRCSGDVFLRRENGAWRVTASRLARAARTP